MAMASLPTNFTLWLRRSEVRIGNHAISPLRSHPRLFAFHLTRCGVGGGLGRLQVKNGMSKVFASGATPPNSEVGKGKASSSKSSDAGGPPPATILAGILVFLIFFWIVGSIIMWIVGLIVNAPPS